MAEVDPQVLFRLHGEEYLSRLEFYPKKVDVLEIYHVPGGAPMINHMSLEETELKHWLNTVPRTSEGRNWHKATAGLRLILGPTPRVDSPSSSILERFPGRMDDISFHRDIPFSRRVFELIIEKFNLPSSTPWAFGTDGSHFQRYNLDDRNKASRRTGFTMRRSTRGVLALNMVLSLSHDPNAGLTCGVVLTWSDAQTAFISKELIGYHAVAGHPLLLPVLFTAYQRRLLHQEGARLWERLLDVETASDQTGVPVMFAHLRTSTPSHDFDRMTKGVLEVVQLAAGWMTYTEVLLSVMEAIRESIRHINTTTPYERLVYVEAAEMVLVEYLGFISNRCRVMFSELQYIYQRGQAQMTALYNYIGKHDAQSTLDIAISSSQIAAASKRDSSAMKGIALLTMVFLPGTYAATFLAMPLFDFTKDSAPTVKTGFWIYWAITIPLTTVVLAAYLTYLVRIRRRDRLEDLKLLRGMKNNEKNRGLTANTTATHNAVGSSMVQGPSVVPRYSTWSRG